MSFIEQPLLAENIETLTQTHWDVIVVGGGMVGATVALGLGQQNFKVLLLENQKPSLNWGEAMPYQTRVSALTRASENILKNLGAWQGIENRRLHPFKAMHVWDDFSGAEIHFSAKEMLEPNLGYVIENQVVQESLWNEIKIQSNITSVFGLEVNDLSLEKNQATIFIATVGKINTQLVIAADGANSNMRQLAEIELITHDYQQCAIVGCVKTEKSHQDTCWQRYTHDGPFAYLAMEDNMSSIAWYLPPEKMSWALGLDDEGFAKAVTEASGEKLGEVIMVGKRAGFPLIRRHASSYVKPHFVLVGDAAHTVHPQAGQGVNLGLLDAAALIETLTDARQKAQQTSQECSRQKKPKDWARHSVLRRYERWRRGDNAIVQRSMEGFDWMFKHQRVKTEFRKVFLPLANQLKPVKNWLMGQVLNGREALPSLAKKRL